MAVKLRDPWTNGGLITYSGPEYDKYGLTAKVEANKTFHMSTKDFRKTFDRIYVAMIANNWNVTKLYFEQSQDDNYNMIFENSQKQNAFLTLDYPTKRMYAEGCPTNTDQLKFFITIKNLNNDTILKKRMQVNRETSYGLVELPNLKPG